MHKSMKFCTYRWGKLLNDFASAFERRRLPEKKEEEPTTSMARQTVVAGH
jgi:hypothetical protein